MTNHKTRTTDRGSAHAGSKDRPKRKPQAYITRAGKSLWKANDEHGQFFALAPKYKEIESICISAGFTPNRNKHGDAPKTK